MCIRDRAFATAHVIATELAIEQAVERGAENLGAARVSPEVAADSVARQGAVLGSPLTPGQQAAVMGIATSGRGVEPVSYTHLDVYKRQPWLYPPRSD